jgi:hypothetical protein
MSKNGNEIVHFPTLYMHQLHQLVLELDITHLLDKDVVINLCKVLKTAVKRQSIVHPEKYNQEISMASLRWTHEAERVIE